MSRTGNETNLRLDSSEEIPCNREIQDFTPSECVCREVSDSNWKAFAGDVDGDKVKGHDEVGAKCKKRKLSKSWSSLWDHFDKLDCAEDNNKKVRCKYCGEEFEAGPMKHVTNGFMYHPNVCKKTPHEVGSSQMHFNMQKSFLGTSNNSEGCVSLMKYDDVRAWRALCTRVIGDENPFRYVESAGFKHLMSVGRPQFNIPSKKSLARGTFQIYTEEKLKLKSFLKESSQRICISIDTWASVQKMNYICLVASFIDNNWELQKKVLNFRPITSQSGEEIAMVVTKCLREWEIENVFTATVDCGFHSKDVVSCLKEMDVWKTSILNNQYVSVRRIVRLINGVVHDVLTGFSERDAVDCIRGAVRYIKSSAVRYEAFSEFAEFECAETKKLLCLDVPNRWNTTYLMLDAATSLKKAFVSFAKSDANYKRDLENSEFDGAPSYDHWEIAKTLVKVMGHLYEINQKISGSSYLTSNSVFHEVSAIDLLLKEWYESDDDDDDALRLYGMARGMMQYIDRHLGSVEKRNKILYYAVILDPRYKLEFVEYCFDKLYDAVTSEKMKKEVKEGMTSLFDEYKRICGDFKCCSNFVSSTSSSSSSSAERPNLEFGERRNPSLMQDFKKIKSGGIGECVKSELERYLAEAVEIENKKDKFNILLWWKVNVHRFPILSKIARDVLAVPVCTVTSEAAFNTQLRVLDAYKSSLLPETVEAFVCTQDWLREFVMPVCVVEEDIREADLLERELSKLSVGSSMSSLVD